MNINNNSSSSNNPSPFRSTKLSLNSLTKSTSSSLNKSNILSSTSTCLNGFLSNLSSNNMNILSNLSPIVSKTVSTLSTTPSATTITSAISSELPSSSVHVPPKVSSLPPSLSSASSSLSEASSSISAASSSLSTGCDSSSSVSSSVSIVTASAAYPSVAESSPSLHNPTTAPMRNYSSSQSMPPNTSLSSRAAGSGSNSHRPTRDLPDIAAISAGKRSNSFSSGDHGIAKNSARDKPVRCNSIGNSYPSSNSAQSCDAVSNPLPSVYAGRGGKHNREPNNLSAKDDIFELKEGGKVSCRGFAAGDCIDFNVERKCGDGGDPWNSSSSTSNNNTNNNCSNDFNKQTNQNSPSVKSGNAPESSDKMTSRTVHFNLSPEDNESSCSPNNNNVSNTINNNNNRYFPSLPFFNTSFDLGSNCQRRGSGSSLPQIPDVTTNRCTGDGNDDPDAVIHINVKNISKSLFSNTSSSSATNLFLNSESSRSDSLPRTRGRVLNRQRARLSDDVIPGYNLNIDLSPPSPVLSSTDVSPESSPSRSSFTSSPRRALPTSPSNQHMSELSLGVSPPTTTTTFSPKSILKSNSSYTSNDTLNSLSYLKTRMNSVDCVSSHRGGIDSLSHQSITDPCRGNYKTPLPPNKIHPPVILENCNPFIYPGSPDSFPDSSDDDEYYCLGDEYTPSPSPPLVPPPRVPAGYVSNSSSTGFCRKQVSTPASLPSKPTFSNTFSSTPIYSSYTGPFSNSYTNGSYSCLAHTTIEEASPDLSKNRANSSASKISSTGCTDAPSSRTNCIKKSSISSFSKLIEPLPLPPIFSSVQTVPLSTVSTSATCSLSSNLSSESTSSSTPTITSSVTASLLGTKGGSALGSSTVQEIVSKHLKENSNNKGTVPSLLWPTGPIKSEPLIKVRLSNIPHFN